MTTHEKAKLVVKAASQNAMTAKIWDGKGEVRVYLSRTNADKTEAGYVRFWTNTEGKKVSKFFCTTSGKGSRTAEFEGESVFRDYLKLKKSA